MKKSTIIIIISLVVAFIGLGFYVSTKKEEDQVISIDDYNINSVISGDDNNGGIGDHVKGTVDGVEPEIYVFEYADYQCPGCATTNPWVNEVLESYGGRVAIVYRSFLLSYHQNAKAAAAAAEAAGLQGYWKEYANLLFANQTEWEYLTGAGRKEKFIEYFSLVSNGKGDTTKFASDMASESVSTKVKFDVALGKRAKISATPAFYIDGEEIDWTKDEDANSKAGFIAFLKKTINAKLEN